MMTSSKSKFLELQTTSRGFRRSLGALLFLGIASANAQIVYVDDSAAGLNNGTTWANAYTRLQDALVPATSGTQIWVAAGTYRPDAGGGQTLGDRMATFQLKNGVVLYGGFSGTETSLEQRDAAANLTVLSGDLSGNDQPSWVNHSDNSHHVVKGSGTNATAALDGFTIRGGNANGGLNDDHGGGMIIQSGSPSVTNCRFEGNSAIFGGGLGLLNATATVASCVFENNRTIPGSGVEGGALYASNGQISIRDSDFMANSAVNGAGGKVATTGSAEFLRCRFWGNTASDRGGAITIETFSGSASILIDSCSFEDNAANVGGALVYSGAGRLRVYDGLFQGNRTTAFAWGGAVALEGTGGAASNIHFRHCDFVDNRAVLGSGGAVAYDGSFFHMVNCRLLGNRANTAANGYGGALYDLVSGSGSGAKLVNCAISGNSARNGGALFGVNQTLINCTIVGNTAVGEAGGVLNTGAVLTATNCILWGNTDGTGTTEEAQIKFGTASFSIIQGLSSLAGSGNSGSDPLLVDANGADNVPGTLDDDLHVMPASPARDSGSNAALPTDVTDADVDGDTAEVLPVDLDGNDRVIAAAVDTGTYELCGDGDGDGVCDEADACPGHDDAMPCPIPTVSQWGIVILLLLVSSAGTILISRRGKSEWRAE